MIQLIAGILVGIGMMYILLDVFKVDAHDRGIGQHEVHRSGDEQVDGEEKGEMLKNSHT